MTDGCSHAICLPLNGDGCRLAQTQHTDDRTTHMLAAAWTAVPNNEIGGWAVTTDGRTLASGGVIAADMVWSREIAEHIADVHNQWLATNTVRIPSRAAIVRGERFEVTPLTVTVHDHEEAFARWQRVVNMFDATAGPLSAPVAAERAAPAPEATPNPAQTL
ncbi:hypothetical protein [Micromonospora carbonacea]|uniref:hypothetical protein n=1 Tax=Micromonospora carbonacea TaxID=47853 RepID=UPI0037197954